MLHQLLIRMTSIHCVSGNIMCRMSWNMGASTPWNPQGLSWPVQGLLNLNFLTSQHESKTSVPIGRYQITPIFSYVTPTADQNELRRPLRTIIRISNTICCPSESQFLHFQLRSHCTPVFAVTVLLWRAISAGSPSPSCAATRSSHEAWSPVTSQAKPMSQNQYETRGSSVRRRWEKARRWFVRRDTIQCLETLNVGNGVAPDSKRILWYSTLVSKVAHTIVPWSLAHLTPNKLHTLPDMLLYNILIISSICA